LRRLFVLVLIAAVVIGGLGCISMPKEKPKLTTLRIGYQPSTHQIAEMVAAEKGWWRDDLKSFGVQEVVEKEFPSGPPEMQAMLADQLDMAYVGTAPVITAISQGLDAKIVAGVNVNGSNLVYRPGLSYDGPQSQAEKSIGTYPPGSIQDTVLKHWLNENNVDLSKVKIIGMTPGDAVTAIIAGRVDGVFLPHPYPADIELKGKGDSVLASGEMWPNHACCSLLVSGKLIRDYPDLVEQIVKTHIRATNYINDHPEAAAKIYSNKTKQDLSMIEYSFKTWDGKWINNPKIQIPSTVEYSKIFHEMNYTKKELTAEDLFNTAFYDKAQ
jgi:NitT/TauT family transport system substrate-binding protein